jgi:hypothetical protein
MRDRDDARRDLDVHHGVLSVAAVAVWSAAAGAAERRRQTPTLARRSAMTASGEKCRSSAPQQAKM